MNKLRSRVAVVTGGNSGIGYAAAKELVAQGAMTIVTGRRQAAIEKAANEIGATSFVADQARIEDTDALYEMIKEQYGKIDILFINAGIVGEIGLISDATPENFDNVMNINFRGAYFTLSKLIPLLNDGASVVILSSIVASTYKSTRSIYQASKAALNSIAKTAAAELAPRKIRVNIISPGPHHTEVLKKTGLDAATIQNIQEHLIEEIPLRKIGDAEDIAKLVVDGGMTL